MPWNSLPGWQEQLISAQARERAVALFTRHRAFLLQRQLVATFEDWEPSGPTGVGDLSRWAAQKFASGYGHTELAFGEIVDLSAKASHPFQQTISTARDHYYAAAELVNPLTTSNGLSVSDANRADVERALRQAVAHVRDCIKALMLLLASA
jgi:hypothetical protein